MNVPTRAEYSKMVKFAYLIHQAKLKFKNYQLEGVLWCIKNERTRQFGEQQQLKGGIIADEMGLGKTITVIATMFINKVKRTLIVVPAALIQQWFNEIYKIMKHKSLVYCSSSTISQRQPSVSQESINNARIVLTTYDALLSPNCLLKKVTWDRVVFDEGHRLSNPKTIRYKKCDEIKSRIRWIITGTPIQNSKKDFQNLCRFLKIEERDRGDTQNREKDCEKKEKFILRRTKDSIGLGLPELIKETISVEWTNQDEIKLATDLHTIIQKQTHVSASSSFNRSLFSIPVKGAFTSILRAKQSCIMMGLIDRERLFVKATVKADAEEATKEPTKEPTLEPTLETEEPNITLDTEEEYNNSFNYSSKLYAVIKLILERKDNKNGKIVFCHYRREIDIIAKYLGSQMKVVCYDGRNSGGKNLSSISDPVDALIIQYKCGCEGLNLQENFSEIYFVSPHWNPSLEDQAVARCHRMGQKKEVRVFSFEMMPFQKDSLTFDQYARGIQDKKRAWMDALFKGDEDGDGDGDFQVAVPVTQEDDTFGDKILDAKLAVTDDTETHITTPIAISI